MRTNLKMLRHLRLVVGLLVCLQATTVLGQLFVPPDFEPGSQYRIAFVTDEEYQATSSDIAVYNGFVQAEGDDWPLTAGPTYFAIASTEGVDAITNVGAAEVPIYTVTARQVASGTDDLFDGMILNPIDANPDGTVQPGSEQIWTGSRTDGTVFPDQGLGSLGDQRFGESGERNGDWISSGADSITAHKRLYGISEVITVPEPPPFFVPSDLSPGEEYRIAFVTDGDEAAENTDIAFYNTFVTDQANESTLTEGVNYFVVGSTETVDARDNVGESSAPIYLTNDTRLADGTDDLWIGSLPVRFDVDQFGVELFSGENVWTGSSSVGLGHPTDFMGAPNARYGRSDDQTNWISLGGQGSNNTERFYAISEVLTVPGGGTIAGDYNGSGLVEQGDLDLVLLHWGDETPPVPEGWVSQLPGTGDFSTTKIDQEELDGVLLHWGNASASAGVVPEPGSVLLVLVGVGIGCVRLRRSVGGIRCTC